MAKFYALGNYTTQGFQGFCKDPGSDRSKAAQIAAEAVGAKMVSFSGLRGSYDFMAVFEGDFAQGAGIKMATEASGTLTNITILEETNLRMKPNLTLITHSHQNTIRGMHNQYKNPQD